MYLLILFNLWCLNLSVRLHVCKHLKKGESSPGEHSRQFGARRARPQVDSSLLISLWHRRHLTSHHSPGHLMNWALPGEDTPQAWAGLTRALSLSFPFSSHRKHWWPYWTCGKLPFSAGERTWHSELPTPIPVEMAQTHTKTWMLFNFQTYHLPFFHFAS